MCVKQGGHTVLGLCPDLNRDEEVSFRGKLKNPLVFRDAMLMLREIVISDAGQRKKDRAEFFDWLNKEIDARSKKYLVFQSGVRKEIRTNINAALDALAEKDGEIKKLLSVRGDIQNELDNTGAWRGYYELERKFWQYLRERDHNLWFVLDPVITVHPDQVSFEAFSADESIYGCLSIELDEFELANAPKLGTTNIDFSAKLAKEMERFRTYTDVELSINPRGFAVDTGQSPEYTEKKTDLPESWIKGFTQVSSAANLNGVTIELTPVDLYDVCSFLRKHKEHKSPRYMKWILEKDKPVKIVFEPFGAELVLSAVYRGEKNREEKIWGRRRWLTAEKLLPAAKTFHVKLLGFGMPQFITADIGKMKMTIGFSSWSANDWVKGAAFNIMSGFIGSGNYRDVYVLLKKYRAMSIGDICDELKSIKKSDVIAGIGSVFKRGEGYFDAASNLVRFRKLCSDPIPEALYRTSQTEFAVKKLMDKSTENLTVRLSDDNEYVFINKYDAGKTELRIDEDGQISGLKCGCKEFNRGPGNISAPCPHILALYMASLKYAGLTLAPDKEYKINDIIEMPL